MKHTFTIKNYQELNALLNDIEFRYCYKCKNIIIHLKCGFERLECLKCN